MPAPLKVRQLNRLPGREDEAPSRVGVTGTIMRGLAEAAAAADALNASAHSTCRATAGCSKPDAWSASAGRAGPTTAPRCHPRPPPAWPAGSSARLPAGPQRPAAQHGSDPGMNASLENLTGPAAEPAAGAGRAASTASTAAPSSTTSIPSRRTGDRALPDVLGPIPSSWAMPCFPDVRPAAACSPCRSSARASGWSSRAATRTGRSGPGPGTPAPPRCRRPRRPSRRGWTRSSCRPPVNAPSRSPTFLAPAGSFSRRSPAR